MPTVPTMPSVELRPIRRLLVANRGEIAVRIIRTARAMGITTVAVFSDADRNAMHVARADEAVRLGPASASESYLHVARVVDAAVRTGCDALHPGYGFLSENAALPAACVAAGITFVGPSATAMHAMGDKITAKATVAAHGVAVVPGCDDAGLDDATFTDAVLRVGLPVLLKPSAGGGGKGMRLVERPGDLSEAIAAARREAQRAFGDSALLAERAVVRARHIEFQIAADAYGTVVDLGERECSLQRRHQKVIEEAPSPWLSPAMRERMSAQARAAAVACGYTNVGTVEFVAVGGDSEEFYFIEMNTRLQVEHPVTEMVHGVDLVELQLRIAAGEPLPADVAGRPVRGHAIEARVYAEDPVSGFLPTGGRVLALREPVGQGIRVDSGLRVGTVVGTEYDPMLAKVIAHGADRAEALHRLDAALGELSILGVGTNVAWLRDLLAEPAVVAGELDTELIDRMPVDIALRPLPDDALAAAVVLSLVASGVGGHAESVTLSDPWMSATGWRLGGSAAQQARITIGTDSPIAMTVRRTGDCWHADIDGRTVEALTIEPGDGWVSTQIDGRRRRYAAALDGDIAWVGDGGAAWPVRIEHRWNSATAARSAAGDGVVTSPLPGTVMDLRVTVGDHVTVGDTVAVVEAMKMEHPLRAMIEGVVAVIHVAVGASVTLGQPVVEIGAPAPNEGTVTG